MDVRVTRDARRARVELLLSVLDVENLRDGLNDLLASEGPYPAYVSGSVAGGFWSCTGSTDPAPAPGAARDDGFRPWRRDR